MADTMSDAAEKKPKKRGATRHCCYGLCKSDSRYQDKEHMKDVTWVIFPKPHINLEKCQRWTRACGRENFTTEKVNKWTYICSKHFVGEKGPTDENPDPIPATYTPLQVSKIMKKRKPPTPRAHPVSKKMLMDATDALLSLQDIPIVTDDMDEIQPLQQEDTDLEACRDTCTQLESVDVAVNTENLAVDKETQTTYVCNNLLASKIDNIVRKNTHETSSASVCTNKVSFEENLQMNFDNISNDDKMFHFYTGLTVSQFMHLFTCFGNEPDRLNYWRGSRTVDSLNRKCEKKLSPKNQLFMTLLKLRQAFPNKDLAFRFGVSVSTVSAIINTWIQFIYRKTESLRKRQFPARHLIKKHLPSCFQSFKNVRVIIDCFEIYAQSSRDFAEQGNMYSSYKNHTTLKCLVGISPSGAVVFLSDTYEGSISDKDIVVKSGLVKYLDPGDLVIADRGFLIKEILQEHSVELNIPPFLGGREKLTAQEEILTKRIARVRIHVERAIERMKKFKIIGKVLPLSLKPVVTQIVHIVGFLVNYQDPLVK